jgi:PAS domain S-box-containing protein
MPNATTIKRFADHPHFPKPAAFRGSKNNKAPMRSQPVILGLGLTILLIISAASIGLDVKSRSDAAWVNHTMGVLNNFSEMRLLFRRAESAARGFALSGKPGLSDEYRDVLNRIDPSFAELKKLVSDNPAQVHLIEATQALSARRLSVATELVRLKAANDADGISALLTGGEGRALMRELNSNFDELTVAEQRLLAIRIADSRRTGALLLSVNLSGALLIILLAAILVLTARRTHRKLEATVVERTEHLASAHEEVRQSTSILQSTFDSMAEAVVVTDAAGEIVLSNPAAEKMLGIKLGLNVRTLDEANVIYQNDGTTPLPKDELPVVRILRGGEFAEREIVVRPRGGTATRHFVVSGRPLRDASGAVSGAALVYHDITASRETERKLQQTQKLEAIGKLTGGVAHDFNNMLTVITGTTEALVDRLQDRPDLIAVARLIDDAATRSTDLVRHMLAFARRQPLQPRNVSINDAVGEIAKLLRPTLGEQIEIETILREDLPLSHIDPSQLANALINMAINARDAMPNGGKLLMETSHVTLDESYARSNPDVLPGAYVMLAITDTGTGMPQAVQEKAFEPFFTTKEVGKGSGLGLSMVYGFVKQSGGHIKIYSEVGHGTSIKLYLPPAQGQAISAHASAPPDSGGSETILVVEDDSLVRGFVVSQLKTLGYKTLVAANSKEALAHLEQGASFELLFTDVVMPGGMTGRELAEAILKERPAIKVLYTSGYTDNSIVHHGRLDEGVLLLTKPYRKPELARMIRLALGSVPAAVRS